MNKETGYFIMKIFKLYWLHKNLYWEQSKMPPTLQMVWHNSNELGVIGIHIPSG